MPQHLDSQKDRGDCGHMGIWGPWTHDDGRRIPSLKPPRLYCQLTISISDLEQDAHIKQNGLKGLETREAEPKNGKWGRWRWHGDECACEFMGRGYCQTNREHLRYWPEAKTGL